MDTCCIFVDLNFPVVVEKPVSDLKWRKWKPLIFINLYLRMKQKVMRAPKWTILLPVSQTGSWINQLPRACLILPSLQWVLCALYGKALSFEEMEYIPEYIYSLPQQEDGYNCGIFVCLYMTMLARNSITYDWPEQIDRFRCKLAVALEKNDPEAFLISPHYNWKFWVLTLYSRWYFPTCKTKLKFKYVQIIFFVVKIIVCATCYYKNELLVCKCDTCVMNIFITLKM